MITSLFNYIRDYLNATSWFELIQWPFWTLLIVVAYCGIHTAQFGKGKLLTLSFQSVLKLVLIYMVATLGYVRYPGLMANFSQLPLFSASETTLSLVNPIGLAGQSLTAFFHAFARLYFLFFCISIAGIFDYPTKNPLTWVVFQGIFVGGAVFVYAAISYVVRLFVRDAVYVINGVFVIAILAIYVVHTIFRVYFTFINKNNNENFQKYNKILTEQKFGSQLTVSFISTLIVVVGIVIATVTGVDRMEISSFNYMAFFVNALMCTITLYIFNHHYVR